MNEGGFAPILEVEIRQFNGYQFAEAEVLPIGEAQLGLFIQAAEAD